MPRYGTRLIFFNLTIKASKKMGIQITQAKKCIMDYGTCFECCKHDECTDSLSRSCTNDLPDRYYPIDYITTD